MAERRRLKQAMTSHDVLMEPWRCRLFSFTFYFLFLHLSLGSYWKWIDSCGIWLKVVLYEAKVSSLGMKWFHKMILLSPAYTKGSVIAKKIRYMYFHILARFEAFWTQFDHSYKYACQSLLQFFCHEIGGTIRPVGIEIFEWGIRKVRSFGHLQESSFVRSRLMSAVYFLIISYIAISQNILLLIFV